MPAPAESRSSLSPVPGEVPPVFETSGLRLRPWRDTDAPEPGQGPDAASLRFMPRGAQPGPDDFAAWLKTRREAMEDRGELHWCIADLVTDQMLGNVQIFRTGPAESRFQGELGYWLRPAARGRGIINEALPPVIAHAFAAVEDGGLGLIRLHAGTDSDNYASQSILGSAGFSRWGADHQAWRRSDGSLSDGVYFELLASADPSSRTSLAWEPVTLEGDGVRLRRWRPGDAERVVQGCTDQRTRHWLAALPSPYSLREANSFIVGCGEDARNGKGLYWCVADPDTNRCLGCVSITGLHQAQGTSGEIGYWTHPQARGRGLTKEAVRLAVRHAFIVIEDGGLGRERLQLQAADSNSASRRIALANGFVEVGRDRRAEALGDGTLVDLVRHDLLVEEWNTR